MKRVVMGAIVLLLTLLVFIALLPSVLSTGYGNELFVKLLNKRISGKLSIEHFHISWVGGQEIQNLTLTDSSDNKIIALPYMKTDSSLISLFRGRIGESSFDKPYLALIRDERGRLNLDKALSNRESKKQKKEKLPFFTGSLNINEGELIYDSPQMHAISIKEINVDYKPDKDIFHIKAKTMQGEVQGEIFASGNLSKHFHILAEVQNFPVAILDQFDFGSFMVSVA